MGQLFYLYTKFYMNKNYYFTFFFSNKSNNHCNKWLPSFCCQKEIKFQKVEGKMGFSSDEIPATKKSNN